MATVPKAEDYLAAGAGKARDYAEELLKAAAPLAPGHAGSAPAAEAYKPGQVVPGTGPPNARGTTTSKTT